MKEEVSQSCNVYRSGGWTFLLKCHNWAIFTSSAGLPVSRETQTEGQKTPVSAGSLPFSLATPAIGYLFYKVESLLYVNIP